MPDDKMPRQTLTTPDDPDTVLDTTSTADDDDAERQRAMSTVLAAFPPPDRRPLRQLPGLTVKALHLVWESGKRESLALAGLQTVAVGLMLGQILVLRRLLTIMTILGGVHAPFGQLTVPASLLLSLVGIMGMVMIGQNSFRNLLTALMARTASDKILDITTTVPLVTFDDATFHDRLARAVIGQHRPLQLVQALTQLAQGATSLLAVTAALVIVNPLLLPLVVLAFVPMTISAAGSGRDMYLLTAWWTPRERQRTYLHTLLSDREAAKEIRAYNLAGYLRRLYNDLYAQYLSDLRQTVRRRTRQGMLTAAISAALAGAVLAALAVLVAAGHISLGEAGTAVIGLLVMGFTVSPVMFAISQLYECAHFIDDYSAFTSRPEPDQHEPATASHGNCRPFNRLRVDDVSFTYPASARASLKNVSMEIRKGEVIALVGENGSGKTTLAKLLCGLYRPGEGRILWDDHDLNQVEQYTRESTAVIFQDFMKYMLEVWQNIGLGRHERIDDWSAITDASTLSGAHVFIDELPYGLKTLLGPVFEGGTELSIGQWQRIALSRAFFRDASFLILDEPTASLDARAEHELFQRIRELAAGRSVLLISHRFSSVRSADRIYVLRRGRIVEEGTHDQLMRLNGLYAELFHLQASSYSIAEPSQ